MPELKNLCAHIPVELYSKVSAAKTVADQTISEYVTRLLTEYYNWKENGGTIMTQNGEKTRTLAFQISENLFRRIKSYLERETERTGTRLTQRDFVIGLIETALAAAERDEDAQSGNADTDGEDTDGIQAETEQTADETANSENGAADETLDSGANSDENSGEDNGGESPDFPDAVWRVTSHTEPELYNI